MESGRLTEKVVVVNASLSTLWERKEETASGFHIIVSNLKNKISTKAFAAVGFFEV